MSAFQYLNASNIKSCMYKSPGLLMPLFWAMKTTNKKVDTNGEIFWNLNAQQYESLYIKVLVCFFLPSIWKLLIYKSPGLLSLKVLFLFFWANDDTGSLFGRWKTNHHLRKIQVWKWIKMVSGRKAGFEKWRQGCEIGRAHSTTRWSDKKVKTGSAYNYVWI